MNDINAAQAQRRPVLIKFEAQWCAWCKKLDREVFAQPQIIKALEHYVCIKVDVDKQRKYYFSIEQHWKCAQKRGSVKNCL